jgi:hypothetical protein
MDNRIVIGHLHGLIFNMVIIQQKCLARSLQSRNRTSYYDGKCTPLEAKSCNDMMTQPKNRRITFLECTKAL